MTSKTPETFVYDPNSAVRSHGFKLTKAVNVRAERVDKRKIKEYLLDLEAVLCISCGDWEKKGSFPTARFQELLRSSLETVYGKKVFTISSGWWTASHQNPDEKECEGYNLYVAAETRFEAARPKEILTIQQALTRLNDVSSTTHMKTFCEVLARFAEEAFCQAVAEQAKVKQAEKDAREANYLLRSITSDIADQAKKNCRFKQRLAALVAEFEAEKVELLEGKKVELKADGIEYESGETVETHVVKAVVEHLTPEQAKGVGDPTQGLLRGMTPNEGPVSLTHFVPTVQ